MVNRIERTSRISYNATRVERVENYSSEQRAARLEEIAAAERERTQIRNYLSQYPNPEHLEFQELLDREMSGGDSSGGKSGMTAEEAPDVIIDIGRGDDDSGVIVDIRR